MRISVLSILAVCLFAASAQAAPISVGGFTFIAGEEAFADEAILVSGVITGADGPTIETVLVGSSISDSFNTGDSGGGVVEVLFTNNAIVNGVGADLVIFELSGDQPAGTPDPAEIFGISIFDGVSFSSFTTVTPIATGFPDPADLTLDVFAVLVDLSSFGIAPGGTTDRVRLHIFNANLGSRSADLTALGALNSVTVPEPSSSAALVIGLSALALCRRRRRVGGSSTGRLKRACS